MTDFAMIDATGDVGVRRERALRNRRIALFTVLALVGGAVGFTFALFEEQASEIWVSDTIPGWLAIVFALVTAAAMIGGSILYKRNTDEVDLGHNVYAGAWGAVVVMVGYPVWFLLWKGRLVPEPSHMAMFLTLYATVCVVYLIRKYR